MSALGGMQEGLTPILLRSQTPAPNEKVLKYLESMSREGEEPYSTPPRSLVDATEYRSTGSALRSPPYSPRSLNNGNGTRALHDDDINGEDADSNIQEGRTSEIGGNREPGPHDPPGPKYESYDSGPSFGNFGPLPADDPPAQGFWNSNLSNIMSAPPNGSVEGGRTAQSAGFTPSLPTKIPLPASEFATSPRAPSIVVATDIPPSKTRSQPGDVSSPKPSLHPMSPKSPARTNGRGLDDDRPLSPLSMRSKVTAKTRATEKGTVYPPLPESRYGDGETNFDIGSPKSRARSKAPSISPSDSPSNVKPASKPASNGIPRSPALGSALSAGHHSRPFSPYRHAPTTADLMYAAARNRALVIPEEDEKQSSLRSKPPSIVASQVSKVPSQVNGKVSSQVSAQRHSATSSQHDQGKMRDRTPSPEGLDPQEAQIVADALAGRTPRTSYYAEQPLEPEVTNHFHDSELCVLLHQEADESLHDFVRKALRKAIRQRVKKLGMKYDAESIKQYRKSYHDHDPGLHLLGTPHSDEEPPKWASDIKREILLMQQRIESIGENLRPQDRSFQGSRFMPEADDYTRTPMTQTVNIQTQPTGTMADSMYQTQGDFLDDGATETQRPSHAGGTSQFRSYAMGDIGRDNSPGSIVLEEELYKLRQKPASQSGRSHHTWEVTRDEDLVDYDDEAEAAPSGLPTIPDTNGDGYPDRGATPSPPLPPLPNEHETDDLAVTQQYRDEYSTERDQLPPWQKIHQRLLNWAIIWPMSELDQALNSTTRGNQVDEVALSIWSTQTYKRYVRARLTESQGGVDRLFVPPNVADAISNAVFNGRHGDACGMLKDLWTPFNLEGMPRLLIVLAKHRSDPNHWVVHRFSLPDGNLTTYDTYQERTLPDGRPLGWWFAIRVAWPNASYPNPDNLVQKMVRLHRPMQLAIENSVAAAGIWRNLLMGSRAERSLDLERMRDLINTEVRNLRQRKQMGKLSVGGPKPNWEEMA